MNQPLITVITVTYNLLDAKRKDLFVQSIESVRNQKYQNIEHIIIDGASTDGTLNLLEDYVSKGWIKYYSESDSGVYDAMNKGIDKSMGKYITFLNSDDYWHDNNGLLTSITLLEEKNADYSFSDARVIKEPDNKYNLWVGNLDDLPFAMHYCHQGMIVRTDILRQIGKFDLQYKTSSDSDMSLKLVLNANFGIRVPLCYTTYRLGGLSADAEKCRVDHSLSFFNHFGAKWGLSQKECYSIWQFKCLDELSPNQCRIIANKIPVIHWRNRLLRKINSKVRKYYKKKCLNILSQIFLGKTRN